MDENSPYACVLILTVCVFCTDLQKAKADRDIKRLRRALRIVEQKRFVTSMQQLVGTRRVLVQKTVPKVLFSSFLKNILRTGHSISGTPAVSPKNRETACQYPENGC